MGYRKLNVYVRAQMMPGTTWPKNWRISSNISRYSGPIFATFTPYESTLCADDGSVAFFSIFQRTLPWQPNNIAIMKANWYYVHSMHVRQICGVICVILPLVILIEYGVSQITRHTQTDIRRWHIPH